MTCGINKVLFLVVASSTAIFSINSATTEALHGEELPEKLDSRIQGLITITTTMTKGSGQSALMHCESKFRSFSLLNVTWYKNGTNLTSNSHYDITHSYEVSPDRSVKSKSTLKITSLSTDDNGSYMCKFNTTDTLQLQIFKLNVIGSNAVDLLLSGLLIISIIFVFILGIHILKYLFRIR